MDRGNAQPGGHGAKMSRRTLLRGTGLGLGGLAGGMLVGCGDDGAKKVDLADESLPPEVTRIRMNSMESLGWSAGASLCTAPLALAPDFLPEEGLTADLIDVPLTAAGADVVNEGALDITQDFMSSTIAGAGMGFKLTVLAGVHSGCIELFARDGINSPRDLAGKKVAVAFGDSAVQGDYAFMVMLMNFIGLPADRTVTSHNGDRLPALLGSGEVDAVLAYQPQAENLRGLPGVRVILSTASDKPWSDYYCCALFANSQFVRKNPVATKRAIRAVMKATDMIARDPERAAKRLVELWPPLNYDETLKFLSHLPYGIWRTVNPEDSLRFWALRLKEIGEIKATPDQIIKHADWRFLDQLKREMAFAPGFPAQRGNLAFECQIEPALDISGPRPG